MKHFAAALALAVAATLPAACDDDVYGRGSLTWSSYPYYGWYDDYYGAFHDGYWGTDGYFWYRLSPDHRRYVRDDRGHFRRDNRNDDRRYRRFERRMDPPRDGTKMPNYPRRRYRPG